MSNKMKLFVVGAGSGDPDEWHEFGSYYLTLAESAELATAADEFNHPAHEVRMDKPGVLMRYECNGDI